MITLRVKLHSSPINSLPVVSYLQTKFTDCVFIDLRHSAGRCTKMYCVDEYC